MTRSGTPQIYQIRTRRTSRRRKGALHHAPAVASLTGPRCFAPRGTLVHLPIERTSTLLLDAAALSSGTRAALFVLAGLLLVGLGVLISFAVVLRRRPVEDEAPSRAMQVGRRSPILVRTRGTGSHSAAGGAGTAMAEVVPSAELELRDLSAPEPTGVIARICPRCRERYDLAYKHCKVDGAELATIN